MKKLLFVDDDEALSELNKKYFTEHGFIADTACNAAEALTLLQTVSYDCIILDIQMDGQDGFELCRLLRDMTETPVIFLTVLTDEISLEYGFHSGGDDYMTKPYRLKELELRIRARIHPHTVSCNGSSNTANQLHIYPDKKQAYIGTQSLELTVNEFHILFFLSQNKGVPFRQEKIYEFLWGEQYNSHSIQVLIMRIRKKIKAISPDKDYIRTQWGKGYVFTE